MPDILVAGRRIEVLAQRPSVPARPWVVFLHEGLGSATHWRDFPARVAARAGCGTLVYSRLGYGGSEARPRPWPAAFLEEEATVTLPALLAAFTIDRPVLYGHSDGGSIALMHAATFPGVARGVVAEAAHVMVEDAGPAGITAMRREFLEGDLRARLQKYHGDRVDDTVNGWSETWLRGDVRDWDIRPLLPAITAPVLVIQGRDDEYGTLAQVDEISNGVSGPVERLVLGGCGHSPHRDQADTVLDAVAQFIRQVS
jgi:pimeloyl-ACP methyl ester carboxylesterase